MLLSYCVEGSVAELICEGLHLLQVLGREEHPLGALEEIMLRLLCVERSVLWLSCDGDPGL